MNNNNIIKVTSAMGITTIMSDYSVSRATAFRAKKRGYLIKDYHKKLYFPGKIDVLLAQKIANNVFWKNHSEMISWRDDLCQEAILRMIEVAKKAENNGFFYVVATNTMRDFCRKMRLTNSLEDKRYDEF